MLAVVIGERRGTMVRQRNDLSPTQAVGLDEGARLGSAGSRFPYEGVTSENVQIWAENFKKFWGTGARVDFYTDGSAKGFLLNRYVEGIYPHSQLGELLAK